VLVLRNGRNVGVLPMADADPATLASLMLGRHHEGRESLVDPAVEAAAAEVPASDQMVVRDWHYDGQPRLAGASLTAARGEVLGVYGLAGSGIETLARGLAGLLPPRLLRGQLELFGRGLPVFRNPVQARRHRVVYLPADRKFEGLMLGRSVTENLLLARLGNGARWGFVNHRKQRRVAREAIDRYSIKTPGPGQEVGYLSGGNQQKILFANRLQSDPAVLVLHEPTRGVDVGARAEIHAEIRAASERGLCVVLLTTDIEEVVDIADRVAIMREGAVVKELTGSEITDDRVLQWAAISEEVDARGE
jgi:ABC-type sugar transport system ATPase subunit